MPAAGNHIFDLDENVTRKPVSYKNRYGITISADLYQPKGFDTSQEHPAIIVGAPYGGVKEQGPGIYAQNLAKRGFVALAFDPSYNGYSGGAPDTSPPPMSSPRTSARPSTTWAPVTS
ncbi:alpha/beta hydrolase [Streptomyces scabiei]|uniref:alpha/beta hydrolase n=1 Tax=Streptomyces scabiei TaxID=1930 RepID=UPI000B320F45|nr:alpha/beta hydrolase [Streptomyces scabiei]